jgi:hypothetical protein
VLLLNILITFFVDIGDEQRVIVVVCVRGVGVTIVVVVFGNVSSILRLCDSNSWIANENGSSIRLFCRIVVESSKFI